MYIKVRQVSTNNEIIINIPKMVLVKKLKQLVYSNLNIETDSQVLIYKGKQLVDDQKLMDYDIKLNDVILLTTKTASSEIIAPSKFDFELKPAQSKFYTKGHLVDVRCEVEGSWYEGVIKDIFFKQYKTTTNTEYLESDLIFKVEGVDNVEWEVTYDNIRPRSFYTYKLSELKVGMKVMANYNIDEPKRRGLWYDMLITKITKKRVIGNIFVGINLIPLEKCVIKYNKELMRLETSSDIQQYQKPIPLRKYPVKCEECEDIKSKNCTLCGCSVCGSKENPNEIILCDECNNGYHLSCLTPPLLQVPSDSEWYCPSCKTDENEIIKAGEKLKLSARKTNKICYKSATTKEWGKGMACVGRTKECTIVPKDHLGPIPGVQVGTCWKFRLQVSEAGVHRPPVAGIHGKETVGAYSLILSGGYEDDVDNGDEFFYTGSGGRDLSGNKRVGEHICDQTLTRMNKALAVSCNAPFNDRIGAEAEDWKAGKPVRVVRNYKLGKHSKYAPKDGNRYDGIYKVVKYFPQKGLSGFIVWRYLLRRDDPTPAPWEEDGQELEMLYPPGYIEAQQSKISATDTNLKRKNVDIRDFLNVPTKKMKKSNCNFQLPVTVKELIDKDVLNEKLWNDCLECVSESEQKFLEKVQELFICICCQDLLKMPVTTECKHNICQECLRRSFKSEIYSCPYCRFDLTVEYNMVVNKELNEILLTLFPFYMNN